MRYYIKISCFSKTPLPQKCNVKKYSYGCKRNKKIAPKHCWRHLPKIAKIPRHKARLFIACFYTIHESLIYSLVSEILSLFVCALSWIVLSAPWIFKTKFDSHFCNPLVLLSVDIVVQYCALFSASLCSRCPSCLVTQHCFAVWHWQLLVHLEYRLPVHSRLCDIIIISSFLYAL